MIVRLMTAHAHNNLNSELIETDCGEVNQDDFSTKSGQVEVFFKNLEDRLIEKIQEADFVFGCVAWLTSKPIIDALSKVNCSIVVQKEDFLRPDSDSHRKWEAELLGLYERLSCKVLRCELPGIAGRLSTSYQYEVDPIRCVGNHNSNKSPAFPRSHHKFVVFSKINKGQKSDSYPFGEVVPFAVWTGSFNFTKNATQSFENAVYITDRKIVDAYANEYAQVFALSEPLNWESQWCAPEYRIGT